MVLGLGTGSTAAFVVDKIGALIKSGGLTDIVGVPTSKRTQEQAASLGIPLSTLDAHPHLDLAIDGADEVDPNLDLVKGRGGALLREKMVEAASDKFVVVVDDSKLVSGLGGSGLAMPVEVVQFCWNYNLVRLQELFKEEGCEAKLRLDGSGKPYVTDNSNYIVDLYFTTPIKDSGAAGKEIAALEGVVEHGLFLDMATAVIIAGGDGFDRLGLIFVLDTLDKASALVLITIPIMLKLLNELLHSAYSARKTAINKQNGVSRWRQRRCSVLGVSSKRSSL
ncbi:putative ribose-5-phosphate isomerase 3, chloroplastic [Sesamum angolense]|uniref:ribose-5-phosphate isomerase n=1 Tax=Sesamum angolense TaxID=2727404 RepID=A0AAE2C6I4_9LAMI|nr:putative ribose-5-phosphate isomerase 3, chloroplastic [Sesamum angolense]